MIDDALGVLLHTQNADGGWGVTAGRRSNAEATAFALLALAALQWTTSSSSVARGLQWLARRQNSDGSWPFGDDPRVGLWVTPLALLAASVFDRRPPASVARAAGWLVRQEGRRLGWLASAVYRVMPAKRSSRIDARLVGWSWTPDAFAWVEPTAHALLALKRIAALGIPCPGFAERVRLGEQFLYDRMCQDGGWNHGNPEVFGVPAPPYPDVTAIALMALHEHRRTTANERSLAVLDAMLGEGESGLTLALAILCLAAHERPVDSLRIRLAGLYRESRFLGETRTLSLALMAMSERPRILVGQA